MLLLPNGISSDWSFGYLLVQSDHMCDAEAVETVSYPTLPRTPHCDPGLLDLPALHPSHISHIHSFLYSLSPHITSLLSFLRSKSTRSLCENLAASIIQHMSVFLLHQILQYNSRDEFLNKCWRQLQG